MVVLVKERNKQMVGLQYIASALMFLTVKSRYVLQYITVLKLTIGLQSAQSAEVVVWHRRPLSFLIFGGGGRKGVWCL